MEEEEVHSDTAASGNDQRPSSAGSLRSATPRAEDYASRRVSSAGGLFEPWMARDYLQGALMGTEIESKP